MAKILDGKAVAEKIYAQIPDQKGKELAIITIGSDSASEVYVRHKIKACQRVGLRGVNYKFDENVPESEIIYQIRELNHSDNVSGIMIQQPYPERFKSDMLEMWIDPEKDVDGLHMENLGFTCMGKEPIYYPATPKGIMTLLKYYNIPVEGKKVVIIGRSDIVGKPLGAMMQAKNATVTICHSKTKSGDLNRYLQNADIIVSAVGKPKFITSENFKVEYDEAGGKHCYTYSHNNPVIIDVGMNRDENGKLCGDVDMADVVLTVGVKAITPVPGGVGPMTVCSLIQNTSEEIC